MLRSKNSFNTIGSIIECKTTKGISFYVDKKDMIKVSKHTWCLGKTGYIVANVDNKVTKLHRYLLGCRDFEIVDHIDGNPLNNVRANLRICTQKENARNNKLQKNNKSGYPGVSYLPKVNKYRVRIMVDRKEIALGRYKDFSEAVKVRQIAERKYFKSFAPCDGALKNVL